MNISLENTSKVTAELTVKIEPADYQAQVEKALKNFRRNATIPGFRKGMVPMSLIKKQYGVGAKAEEVNKVLQNGLYDYIRNNNVQMLGEPINSEKQPELDFEGADEYTFIFDIALAPEFVVELTKEDTLPFYNLAITEELLDQQCKMYQQRAGKMEKVNDYQGNNDMLRGILAELDENGSVKEGGLQVENASLMPTYMKNDEQKAIFNEVKVNDVLTFNPTTAYDGNENELTGLLKIEKDQLAEHSGNFSYQVTEITRFVEAELNQDVFDSVFGAGTVNSVEEFRGKITEQLTEGFASDSDYKFLVDFREFIMNKVGKLEFPDELLKKIMLQNNKEKGEEFVNENYEQSIEELTWHLIKEQLVKAHDINVNNEEIKKMGEQVTRAQFAQYGMFNVPADMLENYVTEMLKKEASVENLVNRVIENKIAAAVKPLVTLDEKSVTVEEFNKMFQE